MLATVLLFTLGAEPLIEAKSRVKDLVVDLRYATKDNFLSTAVYPETARCLLLSTALDKLEAAATALRAKGYRLKVWDCYRPISVQRTLWKAFPRRGYVADPNKGGSLHNRGAAVDLTLVTADGAEVEMPTPYDNFTKAAHHSFTGGTAASLEHRAVLRAAMEAAGFKRNPMEWWHYELPDSMALPARDEPFDAKP